jgi:hypothetical protein
VYGVVNATVFSEFAAHAVEVWSAVCLRRLSDESYSANHQLVGDAAAVVADAHVAEVIVVPAVSAIAARCSVPDVRMATLLPKAVARGYVSAIAAVGISASRALRSDAT